MTIPHLLRAQFPYSKVSFASVNNEAWNCSSFRKHKFNLPPSSRLPFLIKAVKPKSFDNQQQLDEKEKLRRLRISIANTGNTPWNKGKKHTPETLQKISERTRIAMQNPKVKMKLASLRHSRTTETKLKIGARLRKLGEKRHKMKTVQETCCFEWQHLIAEASRQGFIDQEELQWSSYETLDTQLKQEWLESIQQRKLMGRKTSSNKAPKSPQQRKIIAQAISANWAHPNQQR